MRWQPIATHTTSKLFGVTCRDGEVVAVGERGTIVRGDAAALAPMDSGTRENLYALAADANTVVVVGGDLHVGGSSLLLHGGRDGFVAEPSGMQHVLLTVSRGAHDWLAAGYNGAILRGQPGAWRRDQVPHYQHVFASCAAFDRFFVGGLSGSVLELAQGSWRPHVTGADEHVRALTATPSGEIVAVGLGGLALRLAGGRWRRTETPTRENLEAVCVFDGGLLAVGAGGAVIHHDGTGWRALGRWTDADLFGVAARGGTVVCVGAGGAAARLER